MPNEVFTIKSQGCLLTTSQFHDLNEGSGMYRD